MQVDVGAQLVKLLFEQEKVTIPGFGGFVTQYRPAMIDHVEGKMAPPSKSVVFNPNLVIDDGLLVKRVQETYGLSLQEAQEAVEAFARAIKTKLDQRDIVEIDQLGRLYVDYEGHIKLLPDKVNFNTDAFGLPTIQVEPVLREKPSTKPAPGTSTPPKTQNPKPKTSTDSSSGGGQNPIPSSTGASAKLDKTQNSKPKTQNPISPEATPVSANISTWFQRLLPVIGVLTVLIMALGAYVLYFHDDQPDGAIAGKDVPSTRVNIKPSSDEPEAAVDSLTKNGQATSPEDTLAQAEPPKDIPSPAENTEEDTESATLPPGQPYAIVAVGLFGNKNNVKKLIRKIYQKGYEPYTQKEGDLTRVGIQFTFEDDADFEKKFDAIKKTFEPNAKILKKEGG